MGVINRTLGASQRREVVQNEYLPLATGATVVAAIIPYPASLDALQIMAFGLSGAPTGLLVLNRFIPGAGVTAFSIGSTFAFVGFGTSGVQSITFGVSLPQIGSTLTQLQVNDVLMLQTGGANSAVTGLSVGVVIRPLQDVKLQFGIV